MTAPNPETAAARAAKRQAALGIYTPKEIAEYFGFDERTMAIWRSKNTGPSYTKLGKNVYYQMADIHAWIASNTVNPGKRADTEVQGAAADEKQYSMFPEDPEPACACCNDTALGLTLSPAPAFVEHAVNDNTTQAVVNE